MAARRQGHGLPLWQDYREFSLTSFIFMDRTHFQYSQRENKTRILLKIRCSPQLARKEQDNALKKKFFQIRKIRMIMILRVKQY
jgi:hypothetical protein